MTTPEILLDWFDIGIVLGVIVCAVWSICIFPRQGARAKTGIRHPADLLGPLLIAVHLLIGIRQVAQKGDSFRFDFYMAAIIVTLIVIVISYYKAWKKLTVTASKP